jgi:hypothetical protein
MYFMRNTYSGKITDDLDLGLTHEFQQCHMETKLAMEEKSGYKEEKCSHSPGR